MKLYSENENYKLYNGSMLDMLEVIEPNTIDSIVCDPPYELNFMGKGWDNSGIAFQSNTWEQCFKALKEGGYLLAFGGSRTFHRIACAIEDAGFEIRDTIMWLYGSGFPKSMNLSKGLEAKEKLGNAGTRNKRKIEQLCDSEEYTLKQTNNGAMGEIIETTRKEYKIGTDLGKQWQGWGTCLKPAFEPVIVARKPFKGSLVDNVINNGVGGLNIDECRVNAKGEELGRNNHTNPYGSDRTWSVSNTPPQNNVGKASDGRFPANVILTYDDTDYEEVCGGFPNNKGFYRPNCINNSYNQSSNIKLGGGNVSAQYNDSGSASRYFYCAKASKKDRDEGLDGFEIKGAEELLNRVENSDGASWNGKYSSGNAYAGSGAPKKNTHPTVKPTDLMQYLVRLVTSKGGVILDPFNGSGSTGKAVMYENKERQANYKYIGIELTEEYLPIAKARIEYVNDLKEEENPQISIFDIVNASNTN